MVLQEEKKRKHEEKKIDGILSKIDGLLGDIMPSTKCALKEQALDEIGDVGEHFDEDGNKIVNHMPSNCCQGGL